MKKSIIYGLVLFLFIIWSALSLSNVAQARGNEEAPKLKLMDSTAYYDAYGTGHGADGSELIEGLTVAARQQDLGKTCIVYDLNYKLIGIYVVSDVGYGKTLNYGKSRLKPGKPVGDIEAGGCIDIYFRTLSQCRAWGRRQVYVQMIEAEG